MSLAGEGPSLIGSTSSSSDGEWEMADVSMDGENTEIVVQHPLNDALNQEFSRIRNNGSFYEGFPAMQDVTERYHLSQRSSIMADDEYDGSIAGSIPSVSPSDELAFEELDGFWRGKSPENDGNAQKSNINGHLIFCDLLEDALTEISKENANTTPSISERISSPGFKDPEATLNSTTLNIGVKKVESSSSELHSSSNFSFTFSPELMAEIENQKMKSLEGFPDWKVIVQDFHRDKPGLLTEVFRVNLPSLKEGSYWFGPDFVLNCNQHQAPMNAAFVRLITSEGCSGKKYLTAAGKERVELKIGYFDQINDLLSIKVRDDGSLSVNNKAKPMYQKICNRPPDLFFDYNPAMVFVGIITPDHKIKVNILGQDVVHDVDFYSNECQVLYSDHLSKLQNTYSLRVVGLTVFSENLAIMDFNYAIATNLRQIYPTKYHPKFIDLYIPAGANPLYF